MTATLQRQAEFDMPIRNGSALYYFQTAMDALRRDEDQVLNLVNERYFQFAFDIRGAGAERAEIRILGQSFMAYAAGFLHGTTLEERFAENARELRAVIRELLPHQRLTLKAWEVAGAIRCSTQHVMNLCSAPCGGLKLAKDSTVNTSALVTRESVIQFLLGRRCPFTP